MPGTVIGKSLNLGYAGKISRNADAIVGSRFVKTILDGNGLETLSAIPFGFPVVLNDDNTYSKFGDSGSGVSAPLAATFAGFAVGEVKQMTTYGNVSGAGQYETKENCDVLQRGTLTVAVKCADGDCKAGGKVYICLAAGSSVIVLAGLYASATPTGVGNATMAELTNCKFTTGKVDANGVAEVTVTAKLLP